MQSVTYSPTWNIKQTIIEGEKKKNKQKKRKEKKQRNKHKSEKVTQLMFRNLGKAGPLVHQAILFEDYTAEEDIN